jgi:hypothetical protein
LGNAGTHTTDFSAAFGPMCSRTLATTAAAIWSGEACASACRTISARNLAFELIVDANGTLCDIRMFGNHGLHRTCRQPVARNIDHVVCSPHDMDVPIVINKTAITGGVLPVEYLQVAGHESVVVTPNGLQVPRRQRQFDGDVPFDTSAERCTFAVDHFDPVTGIATTRGDPERIGSSSMPRGFAAIGHPVSVCHQLSITGTASSSVAHS